MKVRLEETEELKIEKIIDILDAMSEELQIERVIKINKMKKRAKFQKVK